MKVISATLVLMTTFTTMTMISPIGWIRNKTRRLKRLFLIISNWSFYCENSKQTFNEFFHYRQNGRCWWPRWDWQWDLVSDSNVVCALHEPDNNQLKIWCMWAYGPNFVDCTRRWGEFAASEMDGGYQFEH